MKKKYIKDPRNKSDFEDEITKNVSAFHLPVYLVNI